VFEDQRYLRVNTEEIIRAIHAGARR